MGKKPNACTNAAQTFLYTPTLTHIHAQKRKTSWLTKEEGKHRGSGWAAAAPWATAAAAATASPPQFRPPPPQPPLVPLLGLGPLQPPHPPQAWRQEGWGEKRKGGGVVGKSTEQLPTWSSQSNRRERKGGGAPEEERREGRAGKEEGEGASAQARCGSGWGIGLEKGKGRVRREGSSGHARCAVAPAVPLRFERVAARPLLASVSPVARACLTGLCLMGEWGGEGKSG